ncbi:MAG: hypothetical protein PHN69_05340 [Candidatus Pacebacteria bacterium]|nr:hypothetical protein [Candidatus Paceibacterota bacterium]
MGQEQRGINFNSCPAIYWSDSTKISYLQRRIIVHSILYYESDKSVISDRQFDDLCHQLVQMQNEVDFAEFRKSTYYYAMHDFDGSTGFNIYGRLTKYDKEYLSQIAAHVYASWEKDQEKTERGKPNAKTKRPNK